MSAVHKLIRIQYQSKHSGGFPILQNLPVNSGFSWGRGSKNMAEKYGAHKRDGLENTKKFLSGLGMSVFPKTFRIEPESDGPEILFIDDELINKHLQTKDNTEFKTSANFIYTTSNKISLIVKPADCPCAIVYGQGRAGENYLGLGHWGRTMLDELLPGKSIKAMLNHGCQKESIVVAIAPGISFKNYYIQKEHLSKALPNYQLWSRYAKLRKVKMPNGFEEGRVYLDLLGYIIDQLISAGVLARGIEAYQVDTYSGASRGLCFSHRYALATNQPNKNGRFIVAAKLR